MSDIEKFKCPYCEEYDVEEIPTGEADIEGILWCEVCNEYTIPKSDDKKTLTCSARVCGATLNIGDEIQYDKNYNPFCNSLECTEGIATQGTTLEECWWG